LNRETIRALLVDDDQGDFAVTRAMVKQIQRPIIELDWVATFEEGRDALIADEYDVYIVDYFLEDRTGLDLLREAGRRQLQSPVIMLTGRGSHAVDMEAMQAGAADYLVKGEIGPAELERSIRYALDRVEALTALRESEGRHRGMFDHLPIGVYRCTPEGAFLDANPALVRILGYPDPATLEKSYANNFYVNPADQEHFKSRLSQFGLVRGFETQIRCVDGRQIRLRNTARIQRGADGEVAYVEGTVEDVSNTWRAGGFYEDAARFQAINQHGGIAILTVELSGVIQEVNEALCRLSGYDKDELIGMEYAALWKADDQAGARASIEALAAGSSEPHDGIQTLESKSGTPQSGRVFAALIRDWDEQPDHVLVLFEEKAAG
jgi:PAS domain S-box-containing protein